MADTNENAKKLTNWVDGLPSVDLNKNSDTGSITYWLNGLPYAEVYPEDTLRSSSFMQFFWGLG